MPEETVKDYLHRIRVDTGGSEDSLLSVIGVLEQLRGLLVDIASTNRGLLAAFESIATSTDRIRRATESSNKAIRGSVQARRESKEVTDDLIGALQSAGEAENKFAEETKKAIGWQNPFARVLSQSTTATNTYTKSVYQARDAVLAYEMAARNSPVFAPGYTPGQAPQIVTSGTEAIRKAASYATVSGGAIASNDILSRGMIPSEYIDTISKHGGIPPVVDRARIAAQQVASREQRVSAQISRFDARQSYAAQGYTDLELGRQGRVGMAALQGPGRNVPLYTAQNQAALAQSMKSFGGESRLPNLQLGLSGEIEKIKSLGIGEYLKTGLLDPARKASNFLGSEMKSALESTRKGLGGVLGVLDELSGGWQRHFSWFVQGTVFYFLINGLMEKTKEVVEELNQATEDYIGTQSKLSYILGNTIPDINTEVSTLSQTTARFGIGRTDTGAVILDAARVTKDEAERQELVKSAAKLSALANIEYSESIETIVGITRQNNLSLLESGRVLDILAVLYRTGSDDVIDYADALERAGSLASVMGLSFEEFAGFIAGVSEVVSREGNQLATFLTQLQRTPFIDIGRSRLAFAGIDPTGKTNLEILKEASDLYKTLDPTSTQAQSLIVGLGNTKYISETKAVLESFDSIIERINSIKDSSGEAEKAIEAMMGSLEYQRSRGDAAKESIKTTFLERGGFTSARLNRFESRATRLLYQQRLVGEGMGTFSAAIKAFNDTAWIKGAGFQEEKQYLRDGEIVTVKPEPIPLNELALDIESRIASGESTSPRERRQAELIRAMFPELFEAASQVVSSGVAGGPSAPAIENLQLMRQNERLSVAQLEEMQKLVNEYDKFFLDANFRGDDAKRQIIVMEDGVKTLKTISGSSEAISLATDEMLSNQKRLEGVWGLPGPAMVPIESVFQQAGTQQAAQASIPGGINLPLLLGAASFQSQILGKPEEQQSLIESGGLAPGGQSQILGKSANQQNAIESGGMGVVNNIIQIDGQQVSDVSEIHQGEKFEKNMASGGDFSSNYAPGLGGVFP